MPLSMLHPGETRTIIKINGKDETRLFLEKLGISPGTDITVVSEIGGNFIVMVRDTRIALDALMARRVIV